MITYTTEEVEGWVEYLKQEELLPIPSHVNHPVHGIAAWKARNEAKDEDAEFLRNCEPFFSDDGPKLLEIADLLETLKKERNELADRLANAMSDCETANLEAHRLQKRVAELEAEIAKLSDPVAVHISMLRGVIAWTPENLRHLLGDKAQEPQPDAEGWLPIGGAKMPIDAELKWQDGKATHWRPRMMDADGWIAHKAGDPMPCDGDLMIETILRGRSRGHHKMAGRIWDWDECGEETITHWRPAK